MQLTALVIFILHSFLVGRGAMAATEVTIHGITDTLKPEHEKYAKALKEVAEAFAEAEKLFDDSSFTTRVGWKRETETDDGDVVYSKHVKEGKMCTVSSTFPINASTVMDNVWKATDTLPDWNANINFASTFVTLTDHVDIVTYGNNNILVVTGRDFVSARMFRPIPGGGFIMVSRSVDLPEIPEKKDKIRAHLYLAAARFRPHPDSPSDKTLVDVVTLVDLKGLLPTLVVNQAMPRIMVLDAEYNKKHWQEYADKQKAAAKA